MPFVKFVRAYTVQDGTGKTFKNGQVVEMSEPSARHFINRGAAEPAPGPSATKARKKKSEAKAEDGEPSKPDAV